MSINQTPVRYDPFTGVPIYAEPPAEAPVPEKRSVIEIIFAWVCLFAGYAYCRVFPAIDHPFGGMLYILALFIATAVLLKCKGRRFRLMPVLMSLSVLAVLPAMLLSGNEMIHFLCFTYAQLVWCYFVYAVAGDPLEKGYSDLLPVDFFKAVFVMPFVALGKIFGSLFSRRGRGGKAFLKILLGIAIAIVPAAVVVALLSYDRAFVELFKKLFDFTWSDLFLHLFSFLFGIPIGMYFYSLFHASLYGRCADFDAEGCRKASAGVKFLPKLTVLAAAVPLLAIYAVFFASQWEIYLSAFSGVLPEDFTPAQYAREGFSQLCTVAVINLVLIIAMQLFVRRRAEKSEWITRILSIVFSCVTLGLIATAYSKLYLYITRFGLTPKRVYAGWFMMILAAVFLLIIVKQLIQRFRLIPSATLVCVALFAVLALSGSDQLIAKYNVDRYLDGSLDDVDVEAMEDLGDAAVPELIRLAKELDQKNGTDISQFRYIIEAEGEEEQLYNRVGCALLSAADREPHTFYSFTLPRYRAEQALKAAGIEAPKEQAAEFQYE